MVLVVAMLLTCAGARESDKLFPANATPESVGMDSEKLTAMLQKVRAENIRMHSIIIIRNDRIVLESYIHPYHRELLKQDNSHCQYRLVDSSLKSQVKAKHLSML